MTAAAKSRPMSDELGLVARVLTRASGITFRDGLASTLQAAFHAASADLGLSPEGFLLRLMDWNAEAVDALVERAVVSETYFFRNPEQFEALTSWVISELGHPSQLRLWSAGCATGDEPYSAAISLAHEGRLADHLLATDISRSALTRAREGRYAAWSFRRLDPAIRARYFQEEDGGWRLSQAVLRRVEFAQHNLVRDPPPANDFHVVFCRNVLIYFQGESLTRALECLSSALAPGGFLVVSVPEQPLLSELPLERMERNGVVAFRKPSPRPALKAPPAWRGVARVQPQHEKVREAEAPRVSPPELAPESFLLEAMASESRGDLMGAVEAVRRALYLEPGMAMGHAMLVVLYTKLGATEELERSRRNALRLLEGVPEDTILRAVEPMTAGTLRRALGASARG